LIPLRSDIIFFPPFVIKFYIIAYKGNIIKTTQKNLNKTSKLLGNREEELKKCRYTLNEKEFIISEQRKAGIQDCVSITVSAVMFLLVRKC
jgi:hypothetical protein